MKIQRPGNTESNLLFQNFLKNNYPEKYNSNIEHCFIRWLYTSCGVYDNTVSLNDIPQIVDSNCYKRWILDYEKALKNSFHIECCIGNPTFNDDPPELLETYLRTLNSNSLNVNHHIVIHNGGTQFSGYCWDYRLDNEYRAVFSNHYDLLTNKTVLVISAFSELIQYQHKHNLHKIFKNFPKFDLITYTTPYTFMNSGPDSNFFETLEHLWSDIQKLNFDIALLSCGNYAAMLADKISTLKNKDAVYMGSGCNRMFGIDPNLDPVKYPNWITTIPSKYIPECYKQIENGSYWVKQ